MNRLNSGSEEGLPVYRNVSMVYHGYTLDDEQQFEPCPTGGDDGFTWNSQTSCLGGRSSAVRLYGTSDDGASAHGWNKVPPEKAGSCSRNGKCAANTAERVKWVRKFRQIFGTRVALIEFLPREVCFDEGPEAIKDDPSFACYEAVAFGVYGVHARREF